MKSLKLLNFFSCYGHNGDIHFSREYIKHLMKFIPAEKCIYSHAQSRRNILDIPNLEFVLRSAPCDQNLLWARVGDVLHINTWPGCRNWKYMGNWLRKHPHEGAFVLANHQMYSELINEIHSVGIHVPPLKPLLHYVPTIDYSFYETANIDKFMSENPERIKILVCNGPCRSWQITNFNFDDFLSRLVKNEKLMIIVTQRTNVPGVYFTGDIIKVKGGDLNEISYLSKFCNIIIGRGSGPFCYCEVKDNHYAVNKRFIGITKDPSWAFWWINSKIMRWTPHYHTKHLLSLFYRTLAEIRVVKLL